MVITLVLPASVDTKMLSTDGACRASRGDFFNCCNETRRSIVLVRQLSIFFFFHNQSLLRSLKKGSKYRVACWKERDDEELRF